MTETIREQGEVFSLAPINAIEAVSRAEIDQQITTAKRYPRSLSKVKAEMMEMATLDEETAASCFYSLPRGGKNIQGPGVRLAEIALSCYGNIRAGTRIIETVADGPAPYVAIQAICHDLEKNIAVTMEKRRRIIGKKNKGGIIDEDDINLAANAGSAIAFRDAMFKVVPGILLRPVYEAAKKVAIGDARTLSDRRQKAIDAFAKMGVPANRVLASISKAKVEEVTLEDLETLIGTFSAIKEGSITIENAFPLVVPKQSQSVDKPDYTPPTAGTQSDAPKSEPVEPASAPKEEKKVRTAAAPKKSQDSPQSRLFGALTQEEINKDEFLQGLKFVYAEIPKDIEVLHELSDPICENILTMGLSQTVKEIEEAKAWAGVTK